MYGKRGKCCIRVERGDESLVRRKSNGVGSKDVSSVKNVGTYLILGQNV